jgi:DNA polymerase I
MKTVMYGEPMLEVAPRLTPEQNKIKKKAEGKRGKTLSTSTRTTKEQAAKILEQKNKLKEEGWPKNYIICQNARDLAKIARDISLTHEFAFDCETSSLDPWRCELYCTSFYVNGKAYLVNFKHPLLPTINLSDYRRNLGDYFSRSDIKKYGFNLNFDCHVHEEQAGIKCSFSGFDSELASWLIKTNLAFGERGLKPLCSRYLGIDKPGYKELYGNVAWIVGDPELSAYYACGDAEMHYLLGKEFERQLDEMPVVRKLHDGLEHLVHEADYEEEREGFLLDEEYLRNELAPRMEKEIQEQFEKLVSLGMPRDLNPNSPQQIAKFIFDDLGLPRINGDSTRDYILEELKSKHPFIEAFQEYRETTKLKGTFVDGLNTLMINGRVHPNIRTIGTITGRSSCTDPNMYNFPIKVGPIIRRGFIAEDDNTIIVSKDLKGQELRMQAELCGPGAFATAALSEKIYSEAAATFWGGVADDYPKDEAHPNYMKRHHAKTGVLAIQYGAQKAKIALTFECDKNRAQEFLDAYYAKYPELKRYQENAKRFAKEHGYVQSILGRRCHLDFSTCQNLFQVWELERNAINAPVQMSAADQIKLAFILCRQYLKQHNKKTRVRFRIHDELIFYFDKEELKDPQLNADLDHIMTTCMPCRVPFTTTTEVYGKAWGMKTKED